MGFLDRINERNARSRERISGRLKELSQHTTEAKERIGEKAGDFREKRTQIQKNQSDKRAGYRKQREEIRARMHRPQTPRQKNIRRIYSTVVGMISVVLFVTHSWPSSVFERWGWRLEGWHYGDFPVFIGTAVTVFLILLPIPIVLIRLFAPHEPEPEQRPESRPEQKDFLDE